MDKTSKRKNWEKQPSLRAHLVDVEPANLQSELFRQGLEDINEQPLSTDA